MTPTGPAPPDLEALRKRLADLSGPEYWRSLEEAAQSDAFRRFLHDEFPGGVEPGDTPIDRRRFLTLMGAALALMVASGVTLLAVVAVTIRRGRPAGPR